MDLPLVIHDRRVAAGDQGFGRTYEPGLPAPAVFASHSQSHSHESAGA
jgi:hypothetical protein